MSAVRDLWVTKPGRRTARYGRGLRWQAVWTDADGRRRARSVRLRREAHLFGAYMEERAAVQRDLYAEVEAILSAAEGISDGRL